MAWVGLWATCPTLALAPARNRLHVVLLKGLLASLSFLLHISDLYNVWCESVHILLADDTNLFYKRADFDELIETDYDELESVSLRLLK